MRPNDDTKFTRRRPMRVGLVKVQFFFMLILFVCLAAPPAFGQQRDQMMQQPMMDEPPPDDGGGGGYIYVDYSDQWDDTSGAETNASSIIGSGVTENSYDSEGDLSVVEVTVTSPSGRSSYSAAHGDTYATTITSVPWDWYNPDDIEGFIDVDEGDWDFDIFYTRYCWYGPYWTPYPSYFYGGYYYSPCSFYQSRRRRRIFRRKRIVTHSYKRDFGGDYVPTCQSPCTQPIWRPVLVTAPFIQCKSLYDSYADDCTGGICTNRTVPGRCTQ